MSPKDFSKLPKEKSPLLEAEALEKVTPEAKEKLLEKEREELKEEVLEGIATEEGVIRKRPAGKPRKVVLPLTGAKSSALLEIEAILEQDLGDVYFKMEPVLQQKFKTEGERTAARIEKVLIKTKVKAKKIFKLILNWLKMIPGINKFFMRQEAKIKTDKIMRLKK